MADNKSLIIYYSRKGQNYSNGNIIDLNIGNTELIANYIKEATGADTFKVETVEDYPIDYMETTEVAKKEQQENARPDLKETLDNIDDYDIIYIGTPNWWGTLPMAMFTQLEQLDFSGKTIKPFVTHEGSGLGSVMNDLKKLCSGAEIKNGLPIHGSEADQSKDKVLYWLEE